jgi:hypothetical protein
MAGQTRARPSNAAGKDLGEGIGKTPDVQERAMNSATQERTKGTHGHFVILAAKGWRRLLADSVEKVDHGLRIRKVRVRD